MLLIIVNILLIIVNMLFIIIDSYSYEVYHFISWSLFLLTAADVAATERWDILGSPTIDNAECIIRLYWIRGGFAGARTEVRLCDHHNIGRC